MHFKDGKPDPVSGTVLKITHSREDPASTEEDDEDPVKAAATTGRFLVLETARGRLFIDPTHVAILEAEGAGEPVRQGATARH